MGIIANVFTTPMNKGCSNGGLSDRVTSVTVVNAGGSFEPTADRPAVRLVPGAYRGLVIAIPVGSDDDLQRTMDAAVRSGPGRVGPMFGGAYIACSDSRFREAVEAITGVPFYGAVPLHDRMESAAAYAELTR